MREKTALIAGTTGLVGNHLLNLLLDDPDYTEVRSISRRPSGLNDPKLVEIIIEFEDLEKVAAEVDAEYIFCCLGTTMKKAGSKEAFRKVDYEYPLRLAKISKANGSKHFLLVTAQGANPNSTFFYNRVKGELEDEIKNIGFDCYTVIRPSLILGDRKEKRRIEEIGQFLFTNLQFMFFGPFRKFRGVQASDIALKMKQAALEDNEGWKVIPSIDIQH